MHIYRLNWARRTSRGWCNEWDDTALQTQDSKFEPWWSEAEHATSRSRRLPTILNFYECGEETFCFFETLRPEWDTNTRSPTFQAGSFNHCTRTPPHIRYKIVNVKLQKHYFLLLLIFILKWAWLEMSLGCPERPTGHIIIYIRTLPGYPDAATLDHRRYNVCENWANNEPTTSVTLPSETDKPSRRVVANDGLSEPRSWSKQRYKSESQLLV